MLASTEFHKDFSALRILSHEIGVTGLRLKKTLSTEAISSLIREPSLSDFSWELVKPTTLEFSLERENDHSFKVAISGDLSLKNVCVRCLNPIIYELSLDFSLRMMEKAKFQTDVIEDLSFDSEELEIETYQDQSVGYFYDRCIDLGIILRDQIFLELSDYPHCEEVGQVCKESALLKSEIKEKNNPFVKLLKPSK